MSSQHRPFNRIAPTLLALGAMGSGMFAAEPVLSSPAGTAGTASPGQFAIEWTDDVFAFDPLLAADLLVFDKATAPVIGTDTPLTLTAANIVSVNAHKVVLNAAVTTKLWVYIPAAAARQNSAPASTFPAANVGPTQVYAFVSSTQTTQVNTVTAPAPNSATEDRTLNVAAAVNIVSDEAASSPVALNPEFGTTDDFVFRVKKGATVLGSTTFRKPTTTAGVGSLNRQYPNVALTTPLPVGVNTLTTEVLDPLGRVAATTGTSAVLIWDRAVLTDVSGTRAPAGTPNTFTVDRTNSLVFTGSKFNVGSDSTSVSLVFSGGPGPVTVTPVALTDKTKFQFNVASLPAGTYTATLTQTYSGAGLGGATPTIASTYTIDNSASNLDTTAPVAPTIASPADAATVTSLKPTISGFTEAGAKVDSRFSTDGVTWTDLDQVTADSAGAFSVTATEWGADTLVANTNYFIQVKATDVALNASQWDDAAITVSVPASALKVAVASTTGITTGSNSIKYSNGANPVLTLGLTNLAGGAVSAGALGTGAAAFTASDVTVTGGTVAVSGGSLPFTVTVTPTAAGPVNVTIPAGAFTVAGVANEALSTYTFVRDNAKPTFTSAVSSDGASLTAVGANLKLVVTSPEAIATVDNTKITRAFVGSGGTTLPTFDAGTPSTDRKVWTFLGTGAVPNTATGISLTFASGLLTDYAGNASDAVTAAVTRTFDVAPLSIVSMTSTATAVGKVTPMPFVITFSEPTYGFDLTKLDITNAIATTLTGAGTATYTLNVVPGEGPTPVKVAIKSGASVTDAVGNATTISGSTVGVHLLTRVYDSTLPRVLSLTSSTPAPTSTDDKPTNKTSIPCSIVFSEPVTGLTAAAFQVENGSIASVSGSGSAYTFNIDVAAPTTASKKVRVLLPAAKVADAVLPAGNQNSSVAVMVRNYDGVLPTLDFGTPSPTGTGGTAAAESKVTFNMTVNNGGTSDVLTNKFDASKIVANGGTIESITPTSSSGKLSSVAVVVVFQRNLGSVVSVTALPGAVTDVAGNKNVSASASYTVAGAG